MQPEIDKQLTQLAQTILEQMKAGAEQWFMPWHSGLQEPYNPVTAHIFKGRNAVILWQACIASGYTSNQWATLKQWNQIKGSIRKGAKGVRIFVPKTHQALDLFGGYSSKVSGFKSVHVFNQADVNNYDVDHPDMFSMDEHAFSAANILDDVASKSEANFRFGYEHAAYYPALDLIKMPSRHSFKNTPHTTASEGYYATLMHELVHWTNHTMRAPRKAMFHDAKLNYAFEELVAELGAAILCTQFGNKIEPRKDHAAYLTSWLEVLNNNFDYFYQAYSQAQDAVHWIYKKTNIFPNFWPADTDESPSNNISTDNVAKVAKQTQVKAPHDHAFVRFLKLSVICGHCEDAYVVTVSRYEELTSCPSCFRKNIHQALW